MTTPSIVRRAKERLRLYAYARDPKGRPPKDADPAVAALLVIERMMLPLIFETARWRR